ncbi:MAG: FlgD immunoglobulin-like domain containing protein [Bacteroidota bacterium]
MKTTTIKLGVLAWLLIFCACASVSAQELMQLPHPDRMNAATGISGGGSGPGVGVVLLGSVPPNSGSKPVLVFIHGYTGSSDTWFPEGNNDMYARAFNDGFRTAYVNVYPDRSMWTNGSLFKSQLELITNHYGVNRVVVVAHSKGGLDTDAAVNHYGANGMVERVISLGSPHYGSPLADLAQSGWTSWLGAVFGQNNDATYVMQTGYMNYFRSITGNAVPYRTLGGWDYSFFSSLGPSGSYLSSSGFSYTFGGGGNDGVVPYNYSRRPGSTELYYSGARQTKYDHFELNEGSNVWNTVRGQLPSALSREAAIPMAEIPADYNPTTAVGSRSMIVTNETGGPATFTVDAGARSVHVEVRTQAEASTPKLWDGQNRTGELTLKRAGATEGLVGNYASLYEIATPKTGEYTLGIDEPYVAIITIDGGGQAMMRSDLEGLRQVYRAGETMQLTVNLEDAVGHGIQGATINALVRLTTTLEGELAENGISFPVEFTSTGVAGEYKAITPSFPEAGVYNIALQATKGNFQRSIAHSVGVINNDLAKPLSEENTFDLASYPNPFQDQTTIRFTLEKPETVRLSVLDVMGRELQTFDLTGFGEGTHSVTWDGTNRNGTFVPTGTYLIRIESGNRAQAQRVQVLR